MFRRDYIMRMFEELAKALQVILKLKSETRYTEAEQTVNDALKQFSDRDVYYLLTFDPGELLIELTEKLKLSEENLHAVAELLFQYGEIRRAQMADEDYTLYYTRALALFRFLERNQTQNFSVEILQRIHMLESLCQRE